MERKYCDVCESEITGVSIIDNADAMKFKFSINYLMYGNEEKEMTLCSKCVECLYYYLTNAAELKKAANKMSLRNRIRFLFKMRLKEGEQDGNMGKTT